MSVYLTMREDVEVAASASPTTINWVANNQPMRLDLPLSPGVRNALNEIRQAPMKSSELNRVVMGGDGPQGIIYLKSLLRQLEALQLLRRRLQVDNVLIATLSPHSMHFQYKQHPIDSSTKYVLSKHAFIQREEDHLVVSSPLGYAKVEIFSPAAKNAVILLTTSQTAAELGDQINLSAEVSESLLQFFLNAELLSLADEDNKPLEEQSPELAQWEFHDLIFYARSRFGRAVNGYGGTFRHAPRFAPQPAVKKIASDTLISLPVPDLNRNTMSLTEAMESRRSVWQYGKTPPSLDQLAEFLYRVARVRDIREQFYGPADRRVKIDVTSRPYPSGGAAYPLELYVTVRECVGLDAGLYHYRADNHTLSLARSADDVTRRILDMGAAGQTRPNPPQILITITARFQRVQWKYEGVSYSLIMKECGVLYQSMYLVATALGLAGCALGGGDSDSFANAIGSNIYEESSVGEFALGSLPS